MVDARLSEHHAIAVAADQRVVQVGTPGRVAQRYQQFGRQLTQRIRCHIHQAAAFNKLEVGLDVFLLTGTGQGVGAVVELTRVLQLVPVSHHYLGDAGVIQLLVRVPGRPVVQVFGSLNVVAAFLITGSRLVAKATNQVVVAVTQRLDTHGTKIKLHIILPRRVPFSGAPV